MLSDSLKRKVLALFIPYCDASRDIELLLSQQGFSAHELLQQFEGAFLDTNTHYRFMQEIGKEQVGSIDGGIATYIGEHATGYKSPYLEQLERERDERNGMSFDQFRESGPRLWELELDETRKSRLKFQFEQREKFATQKQSFDIQFDEHKRKEAECFSDNELTSASGVTMDSLKQTIDAELGSLGFEESKRYSSKTYPIFSKALTNEYMLCCGIGNSDDIFLQANCGRINLAFHIREKSFRKAKVEVSPHTEVSGSEKFLILDICAIVPYFADAYASFSSPQELKLNIKAQVTLFNLVFRELEGEVAALLAANS
ncbi:hypothetical protein [Pseudoalteromonas ardens]|uniref:Uncharacterized protein n=1 Tax=Pseudoalteromonas rubra TaxID=43658 RepID=A0A0L0EUR6_9GAMM|nr:hypothetical protein [Pseudoalteromonas sp. R96]KNC68161.1 hypothetical protein AC626_06490 [Pseudoalteromonas rubra]MDK1312956.1 hypothetical protein [Pseudoalteromonas sp. R96]